MKNPFANLSRDKDKVKHKYKKAIETKAWEITKKVVTASLKIKDINDLEKLYNRYFEKYPDAKAEINSHKRINQLKTMCK